MVATGGALFLYGLFHWFTLSHGGSRCSFLGDHVLGSRCLFDDRRCGSFYHRGGLDGLLAIDTVDTNTALLAALYQGILAGICGEQGDLAVGTAL